MKILGIIPARGGSKGIPRKNLVEMAGHPLIYYSIRTARELLQKETIDRFMVSTEDVEITEVARSLGADVPFLRPAGLATDEAKSIDLVLHCLTEYESRGEIFDAVLLLQPTSPIRDSEKLADAIKRFALTNLDSMISCYEEEQITDLKMYRKNSYGTLQPLNEYHNKGIRRQDSKPVLIRNGAVYLTRVPYLTRCKRIISEEPLLMEMSKHDSIDLDTVEDLELLKLRLEDAVSLQKQMKVENKNNAN